MSTSPELPISSMSSTPRQQSRDAKLQLYFSLAAISISAVFWVWAILNTTRSGNFDLGVASFLTVLIAHTILFYHRWRQRGLSISSKCAAIAILGTHLFVAVNYFLGCFIAVMTDLLPAEKQTGFGIYCGIFGILWFISAIVGYETYNSS
mmetsp:Transcript_21145/g.51063  ORF Transcript_21145/g.51063 Transcript_21145/m.51063 type:complete len:150 (+) Transcript_21145:133-582(+)